MNQKSLGLIETRGLAIGIASADAAMKSANVELVGYESTKGGGWTVIKVLGDIGAVKAAVDAARAVAERENGLISTKVIARPSQALEDLIHTSSTVGDRLSVSTPVYTAEEGSKEQSPAPEEQPPAKAEEAAVLSKEGDGPSSAGVDEEPVSTEEPEALVIPPHPEAVPEKEPEKAPPKSTDHRGPGGTKRKGKHG